MIYCLANGFSLSLVQYLDQFDALTHEFWKGYHSFADNPLDDLSLNQQMLLHIKKHFMSYRMSSHPLLPYRIENNRTVLLLGINDDILTSIKITDSSSSILFERNLSMHRFNEYLVLDEMARLIGSSFSTIELNKNNYRNVLFNRSKDWNQIATLSPDLKVQHDGDKTYHVNDHSNQETLYISQIEHKDTSLGFDHPHIEQTIVDRVKSTDRLPKGFATKFVYDHFNSQDLPLKSSSIQYDNGADMWDRLIDRALNDGKHVYATSPNAIERITDNHRKGFLTNATRSNSQNPIYENMHIVISHQPLKEFGEI